MSLRKRFIGTATSFVDGGGETTARAKGAQTAPGMMLEVLSGADGSSVRMRELEGEVERSNARVTSLEAHLQEFEGSLPTKWLDPNLIDDTALGDRHPDSFNVQAYRDLRQAIREAGGNVQPIAVRPAAGRGRYEVIFGRRRLRACREEGLQVWAVVIEMDAQQMYRTMVRENTFRQDLSPYELGRSYLRGLEELKVDQAGLAREIGRSAAHVGQAIAVAGLPAEVVAAFSSPLCIQYRWATALAQALSANHSAVLKAAVEIRQARESGVDSSLTDGAVLDRLVGSAGSVATEREVLGSGDRTAVWGRKRGAITCTFARGALDEQQELELRQFIVAMLERPGTPTTQ